MKKNYTIDLSMITVSELIAQLQALPKKYMRWPVYCCGSDACYLCVDEENRCIVVDEENLFEEEY